jgi:threonine-phosphate decarboxylase
MIYGHGDDLYKFQDKITANFSSNVWYKGPDAQVMDAIQQSIPFVKNYPEPNGDSLCKKLASIYSLNANNFIITNGAAEAFYMIAQAFRQTTATIFTPTFSEYEDAANVNDIQCSFIPFNDLRNDLKIRTRIAFICNPNNPTGQQLETGFLQNLIKANADTLFIVDEAYSDFTASRQSLLPYIYSIRNLLIVHSFTKTFGIPGLRIGFIAGQPEQVEAISRFKIPWAVNAIALHTMEFIADNYKQLKPSIASMLTECMWFREEVNKIGGFEAMRSSTTYFLTKMANGSASALKEYLINYNGCLIRDASNFRGLDHQYFRLATLDREKNILLLNGLRAWKAYTGS